MKTIRFVLSSLIHLIAAAVLVVVIALIAVAATGYRPYVVLSGSMEPEIKTGSICLIDTDCDYDELKVGDVIAFTNGRISVTHRIYEFRDGLICTKGDANDSPDQYFISEGNYLGRYVGSVPFAGYVVAWLQTKRGMILTVTTGVSLMLLDALISETGVKKKIKSKQIEREKEEWPIDKTRNADGGECSGWMACGICLSLSGQWK